MSQHPLEVAGISSHVSAGHCVMEIAKTVAEIEEYSGDSVRKKIQQRHLMAATVATQSQNTKQRWS